MNNAYKKERIFFKFSGELMCAPNLKGFDPAYANKVAEQIKKIVNSSYQVGIVIGGGNIFRGRDSLGVVRSITTNYASDYMGMISTFVNSIGMLDLLENSHNIRAKLFSTPAFPPISDDFNPNETDNYFNEYEVLIYAGGIGQPGFTTDTCAILKAKQLGIDILFKGTKSDGVFDSDPKSNKNAKKYSTLSYNKVIHAGLKVMDFSAVGLAKESEIKIVVFNATKVENISRIIDDYSIGTLIETE